MLQRLSFLIRNIDSHRLLRGTSISFLITTIGVGISLLTRIIIARSLGVEAYGNYSYVLNWIAQITIIAAFGYQISSLRFIASYIKQESYSLLRGFLNHSLKRVAISSICFGMMMILGALLLRNQISEELMWTFLLGGISIPVETLLIVINRNNLALKQVVIAQAPYQIIRYLHLILLVVITFSIFHIPSSAPITMLFYVFTTASMLVFSFIYMRRGLPTQTFIVSPNYIDKNLWNSVSNQLMVDSGLSAFTARIDIILVGLLLDTTNAGIYGIAVTISALIALGLRSVDSIVAPMISEYHTTGETQKLQQVASLATLSIFLYTVVATMVLIIFGPFIISLFGEEFLSSYNSLVILSIGNLFNSLTGTAGFLLTMTGNQSRSVQAYSIGAVVALLGSVILISLMGIEGAAIARVISYIVWNSIMVFYVYRQLRIDSTIFYFIRRIWQSVTS